MQLISQSRRGRWAGSILFAVGTSKAPLVALVALTGAAGFVLAGPLDGRRLLCRLAGIDMLTAAGANAFNQDAGGRSRPTHAPHAPVRSLPGAWPERRASMGCRGAGRRGRHSVAARQLADGGAGVAGRAHILVYTPLKTRTPLAAQAGALVGHLADDGLDRGGGPDRTGAWILGATLFVWQAPHFLAFAWLRRGDYRRGGFRALPVVDRAGHATFGLILLYGLALIPAALSAALAGMAGAVYGSAAGCVSFAAASLRAYRRRTRRAVRRLFWAGLRTSLLLVLMVAYCPRATTRAAGHRHAAEGRDPGPVDRTAGMVRDVVWAFQSARAKRASIRDSVVGAKRRHEYAAPPQKSTAASDSSLEIHGRLWSLGVACTTRSATRSWPRVGQLPRLLVARHGEWCSGSTSDSGSECRTF